MGAAVRLAAFSGADDFRPIGPRTPTESGGAVTLNDAERSVDLAGGSEVADHAAGAPAICFLFAFLAFGHLVVAAAACTFCTE